MHTRRLSSTRLIVPWYPNLWTLFLSMFPSFPITYYLITSLSLYIILFCFYCVFWTNSPNLTSHAVYHSVLYNTILSSLNTITAGPPVDKFWCVLKLRLQYAVSRYGISYQYWISSRGWPIWCGLLSRSLGGSKIAHCEHQRVTNLCTEQLNCTNY